MIEKRLLLLLALIAIGIQGNVRVALELLQRAYPEHIIEVSDTHIVWQDGTCMPADERWGEPSDKAIDYPCLVDHVVQDEYVPGIPEDPAAYAPAGDPGRVRYEPFLYKMYGDSEEEVRRHLVKIVWMPNVFGADKHSLYVTTVNGVHERLQRISDKLETLVQEHPEYIPFFDNPGGTFCWRVVANTTRRSAHSFGMTVDINACLSQYWQWDLRDQGLPISEDTALGYRNEVPWEIVPIFEEEGFIWGGKWKHYDTMHFEYRPELLPGTIPQTQEMHE